MLPQVPREIIYVQKLHFLSFLLSLVLFLSLITGILLGLIVGIATAVLGSTLAYITMVKKQNFITPAQDVIVHRLAPKLANPNLSPSDAAAVATQLFYMLGQSERAKTLLQAYLPSGDPLVHTTLADIYVYSGELPLAAETLEPLIKSHHPLVHWTYGRIYLMQRQYGIALKHFQLAQKLIAEKGLPKAKGSFTRIFLVWSVKSSLYHGLAECYHFLGDSLRTKVYLERGNRFLIDFSLRRGGF